MGDDRKGKPRLFQADLFSSSPSSLTSLNLSSDAKLPGPVPFIVPHVDQKANSLPDPFQQQPLDKDSSQPFNSPERPPSESQGLSQVDLSDETPTEDPLEEQSSERQQPPAILSTPHASAELVTSFETPNSGHAQPPTSTPVPSTLGYPGTLAPDGGTGYNPYRAHNLQRPAHQSAYTLPTTSHQFVPVPDPVQPLQPPTDFPSGSQTEGYHVPQQPIMGQQPNVVQQLLVDQQLVQPYWFFVDRRGYWTPFSRNDSSNIESFYQAGRSEDESCVITTDGGRYDVCLGTRTRHAVYWEEPVSELRRCTWFYKGETDRYFAPYEEQMAEKLEGEFLSAWQYNAWNRRVELGDKGFVVMHNPSVLVHHVPQLQASHMDWSTDNRQSRPCVVKRGFDEIEQVYEGEFPVVDHLVFVVHGLGPAADTRHQSVVDSVDSLRQVGESLLYSHEMPGRSQGGRVEFLPVCYHSALGQDPSAVDKNLKNISLNSISRLREFHNHSLIDLMFYTSPLYYQTIVKCIAEEMNRLLTLFMTRNTSFAGTVSVMGHSLGACILFDILSHQQIPGDVSHAETAVVNEGAIVSEEASVDNELPIPVATVEDALQQLGLGNFNAKLQTEQMDMDSLVMCSGDDLKELGIPLGPRKKMLSFIAEQADLRDQKKRKEAEMKAKEEQAARKAAEEEAKRLAAEQALHMQPGSVREFEFRKLGVGVGQPVMTFPRLDFAPTNLFLCGSPLGRLLAIRGDLERIGLDYSLPTCSSVFNVFHPYDPMASRLEPVVEPMLNVKPFLVPHHKGRKRFHLELKENLGRMGANLKRQIIQGVKQTWQQLNDFARSHYSKDNAEDQDTQLEMVSTQDQSLSDAVTEQSVSEAGEEDIRIGNLNGGRRIDYVLQEKPIESLNEYLFAFSSHFSYWQSEDTSLLVLKEVYRHANDSTVMNPN
ncbi:phospholipase DDHD2-like isoform X2 [Corticium candelabrum]|uniref:phospholipase DDHD2-like isoform X2 n=1 Tax=Corticium candelabrum TaxID=121492 RepID=UPI002E273848|nr:phospholipase DDHD2-like isoform X2 [Corticium candelabrum]